MRSVEADPYLREGYELLGFLLTSQLPAERDAATGRPEQVRDYARGRGYFDQAIEVSGGKDAADAYYGRALARLALGDDLAGARDDLEQAITAIPAEFRDAEPRKINQSIAYLERLADVREKLGDAAGAEAARARVKEVQQAALDAAKAELEEGRVLRDRLNYSEAIKHFDRAIELNPNFDDAFYDRGTCYLKIGNFVPGILDFSRALELNPRIADQVYNKVYQISYVVDLTRVITELNKIVIDHPNVSYVIFLRGFFYVAKTEFKRFDQSDLDQGISDFNRTLELNPKHVTAMLYRGFLYYKMAGLQPEGPERQKLFDRAMEDYFLALKDDPESGISHYLQALCWAQRSADKSLGAEKQEECKKKSLAVLKAAFDMNFKGYERIKNERGFDPVRGEREFTELMRGK
jgi:tetratricopeptide (TPR) repeat protein